MNTLQIEPKKLLEEFRSFYSNLFSYEDNGVVLVRSIEGKKLTDVSFETLFLRPERFRFKFTSSHPYEPLSHITTTTICGQDDISAYLWRKHYQDLPSLEEIESIRMAIAGATGISHGSASTIGQLLIKEPHDWLSSLTDLSFLPDQEVEGVLCKVVYGKIIVSDLDFSMFITYFIDIKTMTLRKLSSTHKSFSSDEIRRNIKLNESIDTNKFKRPTC